MASTAKLDRAKSGSLVSDVSQVVAVSAPSSLITTRLKHVVTKWFEKLFDVWRMCQVELRGEYSVERLTALDVYDRTASSSRIVLMFCGTAIPCLLAIVVLESIPLAPIEHGIQHSTNFWYRTSIGTFMVTHSFVAQYHHGIPDLDLSVKQLVFISALTTVILIPILYGMNVLIGFPMPFFVVLSMAPWSPIVLAISWVLVRHQVHQKPQIIQGFKQQTLVFNSQSLLVIVYPAYTYIFNLYPDSQTWLALLLPAMKLILKNWFGFASRHMTDAKPELVVFNVEIFSALYVSSCMQSASSLSTTIVIMAVDFVQAWMAIKDLYEVFDDPQLKQVLGNGKNATRVLFPLTKYILEVNPSIAQHPSIRIKSFVSAPSSSLTSPARGRVAPSQEWPIAPVGENCSNPKQGTPTVGRVPNENASGPKRFHGPFGRLHTLLTERRFQSLAEREALKTLAARLNDQEQLVVVQKTLRILHIAEFTALIEYAEVFVPVVYSLFCVIAYSFPNGRFYTSFGGMDESELASALGNVMLYGSLELLSFVGLDLIMRHKFRVSTFVQTAFVLETQWAIVQSKLALWMLVVPQFALQHYGSDFSFQFKWLKR